MDYGEYGRRAKQELRANAAAAFPKFVLVSASPRPRPAGGLFRFAAGMRDGGAGAGATWWTGAKSGKDGHAGEPTGFTTCAAAWSPR